MTDDWPQYHAQQAREQMLNKIAQHRAEMKKLAGLPAYVEPGFELATVPKQNGHVEKGYELAPRSKEAQAKFEHRVRSVLREFSNDLRDDPGHARSLQYQHVVERLLQRSVEMYEEAL